MTGPNRSEADRLGKKAAGPLRVGDMLYGFCGGFFGRDSYEDKRVEGIGTDWVVARDERGVPHVATFTDGWTLAVLNEYRTPGRPTDG